MVYTNVLVYEVQAEVISRVVRQDFPAELAGVVPAPDESIVLDDALELRVHTFVLDDMVPNDVPLHVKDLQADESARQALERGLLIVPGRRTL